MDSPEESTAFNVASILAGFGLVTTAYSADSTAALSSLRGRTPLSDAELRGELLSLRLFAAYLGFQMGAKGPNEISRSVISDGNMFHRALTGELFGVIWGDGPDPGVTADVYEMIDKYLESLREKEPQEYRRIEEMRILALKADAMNSRVATYWKVIAPTREGTLKNVGQKFSEYCQSPSDAAVQSVGSEEFFSMLEVGANRAMEDPRVASA